MDKDKIIEAMAEADYVGEHSGDWQKLPDYQKKEYRVAARRMLKALCKQLPQEGAKDILQAYGNLIEWGKDE